MTSSNQVTCAPGQEPIHKINGIFKGQKSEKVFNEAHGVGKVSNRIAKIYYDKTDIFADAKQFIAHYRRLASPCSIMRQRADVIAKTNPGKKVADGWLHGLGVPLEYIEALFEHILQIIVFSSSELYLL